jgi:hypothetical protein
MSQEKAPAFQFYPRDLLADINWMMMNYPERGMYWQLVSVCWLEGSIPADLGAIARILQVDVCAVEDAWRQIGKCFKGSVKDSTKLVHPRLEIERQNQEEWRLKCARGGRASAGKRKHPKDISDEQGRCDLPPTKSQLKGNTSSSSSSSNNNNINIVISEWNKTPEVRKVQKLDKRRKLTLQHRLKEEDWQWADALKKFPLQCFKSNTWKPTFEWFIRCGVVEQILEGKYDFTPHSGNGSKPAYRDTVGAHQEDEVQVNSPEYEAELQKRSRDLFGGLE